MGPVPKGKITISQGAASHKVEVGWYIKEFESCDCCFVFWCYIGKARFYFEFSKIALKVIFGCIYSIFAKKSKALPYQKKKHLKPWKISETPVSCPPRSHSPGSARKLRPKRLGSLQILSSQQKSGTNMVTARIYKWTNTYKYQMVRATGQKERKILWSPPKKKSHSATGSDALVALAALGALEALEALGALVVQPSRTWIQVFSQSSWHCES